MYSFEGFLKYIEKLGGELEKNLSDVGISRDPEVVHQCRVAIRRLRGILGLFQCDPLLLEEIKELASALGPLRDIEVQLGFLKKLDLPIKERRSIMTRKLLQWEIERLRASDLHLNFSSGEFTGRVSRSVGRKGVSPYGIYKTLVKRSKRVAETLDEDPFENYHALRIALKKVRYLLEAVEVVENRFQKSIDHLKEFQDYLGMIPDMEVWILELSSSEELPVLKEALQRKKEEMIWKFDSVKNRIYNIIEEVLNISASLVTGKKESSSQELLSLVSSPEDKKKTVEQLAFRLSPDPKHSKRVADKCKAIFSALQKKTLLKEEDLEILFYAALLHDIGHYLGGSEHHKHSYNLIRSFSCLPLNLPEREKVAIIARNHRKKPSFPSDFLSSKETERVRLLSGILRCADGMELESYEYMEDFTLTASSDALIFTGKPVSSILHERFEKKSSYLAEVLGIEIVYREL